MLTAADERMLIVPVLAGLAAMVVVAWLLAWWQHRPRRVQRLELKPRAVREPRSHVVPGGGVYDWARHGDDR